MHATLLSKFHLANFDSEKGFGVMKQTNVYIWDMDETLILLKSLMNGKYAEAFDGRKDVQKGREIAKMWERHILQTCDVFFFYQQIENYNEPFLTALSEYDDGKNLSDYKFDQDELGLPVDDLNKRKLAYRLRLIAHKYEQGLSNSFDREMMNVWDVLYNTTDEYTDRWLSSARAFLEQCTVGTADSNSCLPTANATISSAGKKHQNVNVLVTSGSLIPSLVKCIFYRLDDIFTYDNVYSAWDVGKLQCFRWISKRYNDPNVRFCVIGDGWEECEAAQAMHWPFVQIDLQPQSSYRFPGLTHKTLGYYFSVIYGNTNAESDED